MKNTKSTSTKRRISLPHLHSSYEIYQILYGTPAHLKAREAYVAVECMRKARGDFILDLRKQEKKMSKTLADFKNCSVLEMFGGGSEYLRYFSYVGLNVSKYSVIDNSEASLLAVNSHVEHTRILGDATRLSEYLRRKYDVILMMHRSLPYIHNYGDLKRLFEETSRFVTKWGCVYVNLESPVITQTKIQTDDNMFETVIPCNSQLGKRLDLPDMKLRFKWEAPNDHYRNTTVSKFPLIDVMSGDKVIERYSIAAPFVQRNWSTDMIVQAIQESPIWYNALNLYQCSNHNDMIDIEDVSELENQDSVTVTDLVITY